MGDRYLIDMADVLRAAGLSVVEQDGWQYRARSSGGYEPDRPWCVMWHHTASAPGADPANDAAYMSYNADAAPIANILLARDGTAWVLAGGATNTNGSGTGDIHTSRGIVPADSMNTYAIGLEIQNSGVGEAYPQAQIDAAFKLSNALTAAYGLAANDVGTHNEYAPDRKIDPAVAWEVEGPWQPGSSTTSGTWTLSDIRDECQRRAGTQPEPIPPTPPQGDDNVICVFQSQSEPREFNAMFFGIADAEGRTIELQWSGHGDDPAVQERIDIMLDNFGPARPLLLAGIKNNRLHPKHRPSDLVDSLHVWTDSDFAP